MTSPIQRIKNRSRIYIGTLLLTCFGLVTIARAVNPPPDGGYPGGNTAEGNNALFNLSGGIWNTALGSQALYSNTTGGSNTGTGFQALLNNSTGSQDTTYGAQALARNTTGANKHSQWIPSTVSQLRS